MAAEDRFTQQDFSMTVCKGRKLRCPGEVALGNIIVEVAKTLLKGIRKALIVAAGLIGKAGRSLGHQRRVPHQHLIRLVAIPDP